MCILSSITVAQAISLRGSGSGARAIQRPGLAALGAGESYTRCIAAMSCGMSVSLGSFSPE
jgi:hypothetical protein